MQHQHNSSEQKSQQTAQGKANSTTLQDTIVPSKFMD
jgi:hypothetical protein